MRNLQTLQDCQSSQKLDFYNKQTSQDSYIYKQPDNDHNTQVSEAQIDHQEIQNKVNILDKE